MLSPFTMWNPLYNLIAASSPLKQILDHETLLGEYKRTSPELMKFLSYDKYSELIDYLIVVGPPEDQKRSYKQIVQLSRFPFIVCDMLCTPNPQFINFTLPDQPIFLEETLTETKEVEVEVEVSDSDSQENTEEVHEQAPVDEHLKIDHLKIGDNEIETRKRNKSRVQVQLPVSDEDEFGEFVKPKKRVKMRQVQEVSRIVRREVPPLLPKLFSYFSGELNYTLSSYVCKVLLALIAEKPIKMLAFLLNPIQIYSMLKHISSRSVHDVLVRICTIESTEFLAQRKTAYELLLRAINSQDEDSISECVLQILTKVVGNLKNANPILAYVEAFTQAQQFQIIADNVLNEGWVKSVPIFKIYISVCTNMAVIKQYLEKVPSRLAQLAQKSKAIYLIEPVAFLAKKSSSMRLRILNAGIFPSLLPLLPQHPFNNFLQNQISTILEQCLADKTIAVNCISETKLLQFLLNERAEELRFVGKNCRKGYMGHLVKWIRIISQSEFLREVAEGDQFTSILSYFQSHIDKEKWQLGGYERKQSKCSNVLSSHESILLYHSIFLAQVRIPSQEDLMAEMQKQLDQYERQQQEREMQEEENQNYEKIFKTHLDYEVNDIMQELD